MSFYFPPPLCISKSVFVFLHFPGPCLSAVKITDVTFTKMKYKQTNKKKHSRDVTNIRTKKRKKIVLYEILFPPPANFKKQQK